jgi:hypothetical protein
MVCHQLRQAREQQGTSQQHMQAGSHPLPLPPAPTLATPASLIAAGGRQLSHSHDHHHHLHQRLQPCTIAAAATAARQHTTSHSTLPLHPANRLVAVGAPSPAVESKSGGCAGAGDATCRQGRAGQGRAGQSRAGQGQQGRAGQGRASRGVTTAHS